MRSNDGAIETGSGIEPYAKAFTCAEGGDFTMIGRKIIGRIFCSEAQLNAVAAFLDVFLRFDLDEGTGRGASPLGFGVVVATTCEPTTSAIVGMAASGGKCFAAASRSLASSFSS